MANQPTKYKKFVATAATATLVASAIVPVASAASFPDLSEAQAKDVDALVGQGIIQGYPDGTFKPNQTLTRGQVVKMLGKWVEAQGFEVPTDWNSVKRFTDLAVDAKDQELVKYAAVVKDSGVFIGNDGALMAAGNITRENMTLVLDRAYKAVFGQSLVEEAAGLPNLTVTDLATAKEEAREEIQAIRNLGISIVDNFNPKGLVTRANFAAFLNRTIEAAGETTPDQGEVTIASLKATAVNQLTVEFNKAVDTEAAKFAVKQGTTTEIKVSDVKWNEAKTVAILEVDHKFVAATYNLTVTGVAEEALTGSVTTTREVVSEIKFNSDKLVLTGAKKTSNGVEYNEARITFDVYNQYGEVITETVPTSYYNDKKLRGLKNDDTITFDESLKGLIIVWIDKDEDEGEEGTISFTYEYADVEIDVDQDVFLSDDLEPGTAVIEGVYNSNDRAFTAENVEKYVKSDTQSNNLLDTTVDKFQLLLSVKDQFGNPISAKESFNKVSGATAASGDTGQIILNSIESGLRVDVSNNDIFDAEEDNVEVVNVDGKYYFAIPLEFDFTDEGYVKATGENTVTIRSKATGEVTESKLALTDSSKVYSIGLSAPSEVVASGDEVKLPVTVVDQDGNAITNAAKLNSDVKDGRIVLGGDIQKPGGGASEKKDATFVFENDKLFLEFDAITNGDDKDSKEMDIEVEVEDSGQETELVLQVQPAAYPATLVSLKTGSTINVFTGLSETIELADIVIEDQYGRVYDDAFTGSQEITAKGISGFLNNQVLTFNAEDEIEVTAPATKDTAVVEFTLKSKDNELKDITSKLSMTVRAVEEKDFASFKVTSDKAAFSDFNGDSEAAEVEVYGVLSNGKEVILPRTAYTLKAEKYLSVTFAPTTGDSVDVFVDESVTENKMEADNVDNVKSSVTVVINRTGQVISQEIVASREDREITRLTIEDEGSVAGKELTKVTLTATEATANLSTAFLTELLTEAEVEARDQYGKKYKEGAGNAIGALQAEENFKFVINNVNAGDDNFTISLNGSENAQISGLSTGDSFDVAVKLGDAIKVIKVQVK